MEAHAWSDQNQKVADLRLFIWKKSFV